MNRAWCVLVGSIVFVGLAVAQDLKKEVLALKKENAELKAKLRKYALLRCDALDAFPAPAKTYGQLQLRKAEVMADVGDWDGMSHFMKKAFESEDDRGLPERAILHSQCAMILRKAGKHEAALWHYNRLESIFVGSQIKIPSSFYSGRSEVHEALKKYPEAIGDLEMAIKGATKEEVTQLQTRLDSLKKRK